MSNERRCDDDEPNTMTAPRELTLRVRVRRIDEPTEPVWHAAIAPFTPACGASGSGHFTTPNLRDVTCAHPVCASLRLRSMN